MQIELQERLGAMKGAWPSPCHRPVSRTGAMQTNSLDGQKYSRRHDTWTSVRDALGSEDSPCVRRERTVRNSPRFLWILGRIVRAAYSFLSLATHTGTTLCVSISWKGTSPKFLLHLRQVCSVSYLSHTSAHSCIDRKLTSQHRPARLHFVTKGCQPPGACAKLLIPLTRSNAYTLPFGMIVKRDTTPRPHWWLGSIRSMRRHSVPRSHARPCLVAPLASSTQWPIVNHQQACATVLHKLWDSLARVSTQHEERDAQRSKLVRRQPQTTQHESEVASASAEILRNLHQM